MQSVSGLMRLSVSSSTLASLDLADDRRALRFTDERDDREDRDVLTDREDLDRFDRRYGVGRLRNFCLSPDNFVLLEKRALADDFEAFEDNDFRPTSVDCELCLLVDELPTLRGCVVRVADVTELERHR